MTRVRHLENALIHFEKASSGTGSQRVSIDSHVRSYYKAHKNRLTLEDREWLVDKFKDLYRWRSLVDHFASRGGTVTQSDRLRTYFGNDGWRSYAKSKTIEDHIRLSVPRELYETLVKQYGKSKTEEICLIMNESPLCFLRVNPFVVESREKVITELSRRPGVSVDKTDESDIGIKLSRCPSLSTLPELQSHWVDIQDESSQLVGLEAGVKPGDIVLDFCAGSGGKSLVMAPLLQRKGHIYLHDVEETYLNQARKKLHNARIRNFSILSAGSDQMETFRKSKGADIVLVDAPSTSSGSYRRYPERKWSFSRSSLDELVAKQREIFTQAIRFLRKKNSSKIIYSVSSILAEETKHQIEYFCEEHKLYLSKPPRIILPKSHGMDGYFCAILERQ